MKNSGKIHTKADTHKVPHITKENKDAVLRKATISPSAHEEKQILS
ncbi:MAG: hypothetical protein V8R91_06885 [Butyricimonas faecihominis]